MGNRCISLMGCQNVCSSESAPETNPDTNPETNPETNPDTNPETNPDAVILDMSNLDVSNLDDQQKSTPTPEKLPVKVIKHALLIGINYTGQEGELRGCINDVENLQFMLKKNNMFKDSEMTVLTDKDTGHLHPTRANIMDHLQDLVKLAKDNLDAEVHLLVSYSGHGSYQSDKNHDEADSRDEMLCPIDYYLNGFIVDDDIKSQFVDQLPSNVKCTMIIDACHSGTIVDLKYNYAIDLNNSCKVSATVTDSACNIIVISGCTDTQTSADAYLTDDVTKKYEYQGAMTKSLLANYKDGISYYDLLTKMRAWLKNNNGFTQIPQLSSGKMLNTKDVCMVCKLK